MTRFYEKTNKIRLQDEREVEVFVKEVSSPVKRPKCILLHGNPASLRDWGELIEPFSTFVDIVAIDFPGFGKSPKPKGGALPISLSRLADDVIAVSDSLGWHEPFFIIGHSHGGGVAQTVAVNHSKRVAGIVLIATFGAPTHLSYRLLATPGASLVVRLVGKLFLIKSIHWALRIVLKKTMKDIFFPEEVPQTEVEYQLQVFSNRPEILLSMVHVALGQPCKQLYDLAIQIQCPVLFIHGADDQLVPSKYSKIIHERIVQGGGESEYILLPNTGHMLLQFQTDQVVEAITRFTTSQ